MASGQVFIQPKCARHRARDLRNFERMCESRPVMIALVRDKNLRFLFQSAKRGRVNNPVTIALKWRSCADCGSSMKRPREASHMVA